MTIPEFASDGVWMEIRGRGWAIAVRNPGGYPEPGVLAGQRVRIDGVEYDVRGVETFRIVRPYPESYGFSLLVAGAPALHQLDAAKLLDRVIASDDEHGDLANATGDELRDALRLAASRLRERKQRTERDPLLRGARRLVAEVWALVDNRIVGARSPAGDAALDLRDTIDSTWQPRVEEERP